MAVVVLVVDAATRELVQLQQEVLEALQPLAVAAAVVVRVLYLQQLETEVLVEAVLQ